MRHLTSAQTMDLIWVRCVVERAGKVNYREQISRQRL